MNYLNTAYYRILRISKNSKNVFLLDKYSNTGELIAQVVRNFSQGLKGEKTTQLY